MEKIKFVDTTLRDGHQSLMATRMKTSDMLPILEKIDEVGYHAIEMWGGATYDSCIRFLNEDPWVRLREIKKRMKKTKLQMLLRGQNLLGYRHYADDIVDKFVQKSIENGIDIIRIFDALNDIRNISKACEATKKYGGHAQLAISYTVSPVHTIEHYVEQVKEMESIGADSICIKDMSGIMTPQAGAELVKSIKANISIPLEIHTHSTAGIAQMTYLSCINAGADIVDTAISAFGDGTSQPPIESLLIGLEGNSRRPDFDMDLLSDIAEYFKPIRDGYIADGTLLSKALVVEPNIIKYQLPGGMLSNLLSQLKSQKAEHRYEEVLKEIPNVRRELGYPPLVTPLSQMVGTQSVFNVIIGERYKLIPTEIKKYVAGRYGRPPAELSPEMVEKIIGNMERIDCRPADLMEDEFDKLKSELGDLAKSDEDVLTYALFPEIAKDFLTNRG